MITISERGQAIVRACEQKVALQAKAEALSDESRQLIERLKQISDEQHGILQNMRDLDLKIEFLAAELHG